MTESDTDQDLMVLIQAGDHQAFSVLVRRHTQKFFNLAFRSLHNEADAQDIVQACFLKLWQNPNMYSPNKKAQFTTWFYRVVLNACEDLRRKNKVRAYQDIDEMADIYGTEGSQESDMVVSEDQIALEKAIADLPDRQKDALNLVVYQEMKQKEAAETMGVGVKALESLLSRAKATLKDKMKKNKTMEEPAYATR